MVMESFEDCLEDVQRKLEKRGECHIATDVVAEEELKLDDSVTNQNNGG
jgi:hypothetical protein